MPCPERSLLDLISVIIPVHTAGPETEKKLLSVLEQTWPDLEVILAANGSAEALAFCHSLSSRFPAMKTAVCKGTLGEVRQQALSAAKGTYVCFLDSDDSFHDASSLRTMADSLAAGDADILVTAYDRCIRKKDGRLERIRAYEGDLFRRTDAGSLPFLFSAFFSVGHLAYVWGKLYRRSFLEKSDAFFPAVNYCEDKGFNILLAAGGAKYAFLDEVCYDYFIDRTAPLRPVNSFRATWKEAFRPLRKGIEKGIYPKKYLVIYDIHLLFGLIFHAKQEYSRNGADSAYDRILAVVREHVSDEETVKAADRLLKSSALRSLGSSSYGAGLTALCRLLTGGKETITAGLLLFLFTAKIDTAHSPSGHRKGVKKDSTKDGFDR